jgi:hypothetical protein
MIVLLVVVVLFGAGRAATDRSAADTRAPACTAESMEGDRFALGTRVRLGGLKAADLNGAIGHVTTPPPGEAPPADGRVPVALMGAVARRRAATVAVKPENLEALPPQQAVEIRSFKVRALPVNLFAAALGTAR